MKKETRYLWLVAGIPPLVGFIYGANLLFSTESTGSFDFFPGLGPGIRVFIISCGVSVLLIALVGIQKLAVRLWSKGSASSRSWVYVIVALTICGLIVLGAKLQDLIMY